MEGTELKNDSAMFTFSVDSNNRHVKWHLSSIFSTKFGGIFGSALSTALLLT